MAEPAHPQYPVFVMCGRDAERRKLLKVIDPQGTYKAKALLPFLGKRLIDWQLEELRQSPFVEDIYLIGLSPDDISFDFPVYYIPAETTADFADKLVLGLDYLVSMGKEPELVVVSSADAPAINIKDINTFFKSLVQYKDYEFVISLVPEQVAEAVFPQSGRVTARFKDHQVFPGELFALSPRAIRVGHEVINEIGQRRRKINRQVRNISLGPLLRYLARRPKTWPVLFKYVLGTATMADAEGAFSSAFGCATKGVIIEDAGFGMDMDLPEDYSRLEDYVRKIKLDGEAVD